jgi:hypothetical protein
MGVCRPDVAGPPVGLAGQDTLQTNFESFLFKLPNGWNPAEKEDATLLIAPAPRLRSVTSIRLAANDVDVDPQKSFNNFWFGFRRQYRVERGGQIARLSSKKGYDANFTTVVAADKMGKQWNVYLAGVQYQKRFETIMFWSDLLPGTAYDKYLDKFLTFLDDLSLADPLPASKITPSQAAPSAPSAEDAVPQLKAGSLQGVYVCTGGADGRPTNKQYIFYPEGLMVYGLPQEGMIGFDFDRYRSESNPTGNWVGRYQLDGDKVKIVWQNQFGDPAHPVLIKIDETSAHPPWDPGWDTFIPMCRCAGKVFSGKYIWGAPAGDQYLQFSNDGTFVDHRVTDQLIVPSPFYSRPRIQRGTYTIQSQTIIFSFADGHRGTRTFVAPKAQENDPMFDWIGLGWQQLYEENYRAKLQSRP